MSKYDAFQTACQAHVKTITEAGDAHGVDRHLLGLKLMVKPTDPPSAFFTHPVYAQSSQWTLSTSGLFFSDRMLATGFGAVVSCNVQWMFKLRFLYLHIGNMKLGC